MGYQTEREECDHSSCDMKCIWGEWGDCSPQCVDGWRVRRRTSNEHLGAYCPEKHTNTEHCNRVPVIKDQPCDNCMDLYDKCALVDKQFCTDIRYKDLTEELCNKHCGHCEDSNLIRLKNTNFKALTKYNGKTSDRIYLAVVHDQTCDAVCKQLIEDMNFLEPHLASQSNNKIFTAQLDASLYFKLAADLGITEFPTLISLNPIANKFVNSSDFGGSFTQEDLVQIAQTAWIISEDLFNFKENIKSQIENVNNIPKNYHVVEAWFIATHDSTCILCTWP